MPCSEPGLMLSSSRGRGGRCTFAPPRERRGAHMRRRTLYVPALIVAAVLVACAAALLALSEKAEATFPGKNGRIAYDAYALGRGSPSQIFTINPGGGGKTKVTNPRVGGDEEPSYSPNGKRIAYSDYDEDFDHE